MSEHDVAGRSAPAFVEVAASATAAPSAAPAQGVGTADYEVLDLGDLVLQSGVTLSGARLAYKTYGELNTARDNAVLMPTFFGGRHIDAEPMCAPGRALDTESYFVIVPNMLGNGLSSSPSNTDAPHDGPRFPEVTVYDNVRCQHRLVTERLGIDRLRLVVGFSMGAQQAFQWAVSYPEMVGALAPICGSARTSIQNRLFLGAARTALATSPDFDDGWYRAPPERGLLAFCRVYGALVACSAFYREREYSKLGLASPEDTVRFFEGFFRQRDANDLLSGLSTWQRADVSANDVYEGDLGAALGAIESRAIVMPSRTDVLFGVEDSEVEASQMPNAELRPIPSAWGHLAGFGANRPDNEFIDTALNELLALAG
jgi:homoserine O-acetyltransferase